MNLQNNDGYTALMIAARYSNTTSTEKTVELLLKAGADVNIQNKKGYTALVLAARYSYTKSRQAMTSTEGTIKLLLKDWS